MQSKLSTSCKFIKSTKVLTLLKFFRSVFDSLKPGGRFVLEPQQWKSYQNRRRASEAIKATFKSIKVKPADFARVLVDDVGFESCELLGTPDDEALPEGFRRPIFCAVKGPGA